MHITSGKSLWKAATAIGGISSTNEAKVHRLIGHLGVSGERWERETRVVEASINQVGLYIVFSFVSTFFINVSAEQVWAS